MAYFYLVAILGCRQCEIIVMRRSSRRKISISRININVVVGGDDYFLRGYWRSPTRRRAISMSLARSASYSAFATLAVPAVIWPRKDITFARAVRFLSCAGFAAFEASSERAFRQAARQTSPTASNRRCDGGQWLLIDGAYKSPFFRHRPGAVWRGSFAAQAARHARSMSVKQQISGARSSMASLYHYCRLFSSSHVLSLVPTLLAASLCDARFFSASNITSARRRIHVARRGEIMFSWAASTSCRGRSRYGQRRQPQRAYAATRGVRPTCAPLSKIFIASSTSINEEPPMAGAEHLRAPSAKRRRATGQHLLREVNGAAAISRAS